MFSLSWKLCTQKLGFHRDLSTVLQTSVRRPRARTNAACWVDVPRLMWITAVLWRAGVDRCCGTCGKSKQCRLECLFAGLSVFAECRHRCTSSAGACVRCRVIVDSTENNAIGAVCPSVCVCDCARPRVISWHHPSVNYWTPQMNHCLKQFYLTVTLFYIVCYQKTKLYCTTLGLALIISH